MTDGLTLLTAPVVIVNPTRALLSRRSDFSLFTPDRVVLGRVAESSGGARPTMAGVPRAPLVVSDPGGATIYSLGTPDGHLRLSFSVLDPDDNAIGSVEQDNAVFAPRFSLSAADGSSAHLSGGGLGGGAWTIATDAGVIATAKRPLQYAGLAGLGSRGYVVELHPDLAGPMRAVVLLSVVCLDIVRVVKRRRSSS